MLKKSMLLFATMVTLWGMGSTVGAEIIPSQGPGQQIGPPAVVLCDTLTLRKGPGADTDTVRILHYGDRFMVLNQKDGWAECVFTDDVDGGPEGWVNADYIAIDPAWYRTDSTTTVYAWNDIGASKVAQLSKDTSLPILKDDGDWLVVSLRGATGWIRKNDADYASSGSQSGKSSEESSDRMPEETDWFTVYAEDGSTVSIHWVEGAMYEDARGRTYSHTEGEEYYCITTDITYYSDPSAWDRQVVSFMVYAEDGSSAEIHSTEGAMYEDARGRTYTNTHGDMYYCITTDVTYSSDPDVWINGEPVPDDDEWTSEDFGENPDYEYEDTGDQEWTGEDYGENPDYEYEDTGDQEWTGEDYGENYN